MDFRQATDELFNGIGQPQLAKALGVSVATIRQARLRQDAASHRAPPRDWEEAVIRLSEQQIAQYRQLIRSLLAERR